MLFNVQKVEIANLIEPNNYAIESKKILASVNSKGVILSAFSPHSVNPKVLMANITDNIGFSNLSSLIANLKMYPKELILVTLKGSNECLMKKVINDVSMVGKVYIDVIENENFNSLIVDKNKTIYQDNLVATNYQLSLQNKKEIDITLSKSFKHIPKYKQAVEDKKPLEQLPKFSCNIL